jgi:excisionase family DNA binding protein
MSQIDRILVEAIKKFLNNLNWQKIAGEFYIGIQEAAQCLECDPNNIYKYVHFNKIETLQSGRNRLIHRNDLQGFILSKKKIAV